MTPLVPCPACGRHVRGAEAACPFCGAATVRPRVSRARLRATTRATIFYLGASLAGGCGVFERATEEESIAQPYGAPPEPPPEESIAQPYGAPPDRPPDEPLPEPDPTPSDPR